MSELPTKRRKTSSPSWARCNNRDLRCRASRQDAARMIRESRISWISPKWTIGQQAVAQLPVLRWRSALWQVRLRARRRGRKHSFFDQCLAVNEAMAKVDFKHVNGRPADRRETDHNRPPPCEMLAPAILTGMEEPRHLARVGIDTGDVWPLVIIAASVSGL